MKQSFPAESEHQRQPSNHAADVLSHVNDQKSLVDNRLQTFVQRELLETIDSSPRMIAQSRMAESFRNSPHTAAQKTMRSSVNSISEQLQIKPTTALLQPSIGLESTDANNNGQNKSIQLFKDFAGWREEAGIMDDKEATLAYLKMAAPKMKTLIQQLTGYTIDEKTRPEQLQEGVVRDTLAAFRNLYFKQSKSKPIDSLEYKALSDCLTELEHSARVQDSAGEMVNTGVFGASTPDLMQLIVSYLPVSSLASIRGTNYFLKALVDSQILFSLKFLDQQMTVKVRFMDVSNYMKDYDFSGLHGSSLKDSASLYRGLKPRPNVEDRVYPTSQLGEGFYLTEGSGIAEQGYALSVARERAKMTQTQAVIFRVFIETSKIIKQEVPPEDWADMQKGTTPESLKELSLQPLALTAPVVQNEHVDQIKINPSLFQLVRILPPRGFDDSQFCVWLTEVISQNPFEWGEIEYHYKQ